jgi:hypothetical protein
VRRLAFLAAMFVLAVSCGGESEGRGSVSEGDEAPGFTLPSAAGGNVALSDFTGHRPVLLYFSMGPG